MLQTTAPQSLDQQLAALLDRVLDPEFGLIRYISEIPVQSGEPDIFIAVAEYANPLETPPRSNVARGRMHNRQAAGAGLERTSTLWSTVGEALERYAGMIYDPAEILRARAVDLAPGSYVSPNDFLLFDDAQYGTPGFPFARFDPEREIGWTTGRRLSDGRTFLLPASLVYMAYHVLDRGEFMADVYSTGLAIGPDRGWAAATALREVIERDCFGLHWATRTPPRRIDIEPILGRFDPAFARMCRHEGVDLFVGDMTSELGIPGILSVVRPRQYSGVALGASCHPCPAVALEKAVIESFHTYNWLVEMRRWPRDMSPDALREFADHVRLHLDEEHLARASFLWESNDRSVLFDSGDAFHNPSAMVQIARMADALGKHGYDAYLIDITPDDIAELDLAVVRAVAPGLQPIWAGSSRASVDRRRADRFLRAIGRQVDTPINIDPHPFP